MNLNSEFQDKTNAYWIVSTEKTSYPQLKSDIKVDVAIIGGGIVGITTAYLLSQQGVKVAILEADYILQGTTGHTTAKITSQHSFIYAKLKKDHGEELAKQYADANESAIHMIAKTIEDNKIECDFRWRHAYLYTTLDKYVKQIEDEVRAAKSLGIKAEFVEEINLPLTIKGAMKFEGQAQFHPLKYLKTLAEKVVANGGQIYEQTEVIQIDENEVVITRNKHKVKADKVVIATHYPAFDGGGFFFSRITQDRSYVLGLTIDGEFPDGSYINAESPSRSLRSQPYKDGELILVGGDRHKTGQGQDTNIHYKNLLDFANETFKVQDVICRWSTQDCLTADGVPYIGNLTARSPNLYVATGFGKWGMSNGTVSGMLLSDLIVKGESPWAEIYKPSRFTSASLKSFVVQNIDVAKNFVKGKIESLPEEVDINPGEAAIIKTNDQRIGVYKDEENRLSMIDTTCTHLGCELGWNTAEKSWDCPCHGSRFNSAGEVLHGPAIEPLHHLGADKNWVEARVFK
ncbi:MAG TPA: FAD-dependent oxidoreductase [Syntrophomonadaceae bacterium]|nr:FAD-dependent oxidoreductase [Syntrophomonadaceae bacterium]